MLPPLWGHPGGPVVPWGMWQPEPPCTSHSQRWWQLLGPLRDVVMDQNVKAHLRPLLLGGSAAPGAGRGREKLELSREGGAGSSAGCRERGLGAAGMSPCRAGMLPAGSAAFAIPTGKAGIRDQSGRVRHPLVLLGSPPPPGVLRGLLGLGLGRDPPGKGNSGCSGTGEKDRDSG